MEDKQIDEQVQSIPEPDKDTRYELVFTATGSVGRGTADYTPAELQEKNS